MVEITITKLMDDIPFQEDLLFYISEYRRDKIIRYKNEQDRKRSLLAELLIRKAVIEKTGLKKVVICRNKYGKPYLKDVRGIYFNISHSGDYVAIALSKKNIGIDIQKKEMVDYRIVERLFCPKEVQTIFSYIDEKQRIDAFYRIWTLKESYVKAIGKGLNIPFSSFEFDIGDTIKVNNSDQGYVFHFYNTYIQEYSLAVCCAEQNFNNIICFMHEEQLCDYMRILLK